MKNKKEIAIIAHLKKEIHQAVLNQETEKAESLKYLLSLLEKESYRQDNFSQEKALQILNGEMKKKQEALALFEKGDREDLAQKEKQEIILLEKLLPPALKEEEIRKLVQEALKKSSNFGQVMSEVMKAVNNRASGEQVARIVKEEQG